MHKYRILLVDDHFLLMEGIRNVLAPFPDFRVVGMATSGEEAVKLATQHKPHLIILDISMPHMHGLDTTKALRARCPMAKILIYTMHDDQRFLLELIHAGIMGHVVKGDPPETLLQAIHALRKGHTFFSGHDAGGYWTGLLRERLANPPDDGLSTLSPREKEVLRFLADGTPIRHIAKELHISPKTVESHKYNILTKLSISSLSELTKIAIRHGLVQV